MMSTNKLILAGQQLPNICYNLKQNDKLPQHVWESMERCVRDWDEALRELKESTLKQARYTKEE